MVARTDLEHRVTVIVSEASVSQGSEHHSGPRVVSLTSMTNRTRGVNGLLSILEAPAKPATKNNKHLENNYTSGQICFSLLD